MCDALGGPRLRLTIRRDGTSLATGEMGVNSLTYNISGSDNFGNYTCNANIDDREITESVLVVGTYVCASIIDICYVRMCVFKTACCILKVKLLHHSSLTDKVHN